MRQKRSRRHTVDDAIPSLPHARTIVTIADGFYYNIISSNSIGKRESLVPRAVGAIRTRNNTVVGVMLIGVCPQSAHLSRERANPFERSPIGICWRCWHYDNIISSHGRRGKNDFEKLHGTTRYRIILS